jgi:hypothetical protein
MGEIIVFWLICFLLGFAVLLAVAGIQLPEERGISCPVLENWLEGEFSNAAVFWERDENVTYAYSVTPDTSRLILNADGSFEMVLRVCGGMNHDQSYEIHQSGTYTVHNCKLEDQISGGRTAFEGLLEVYPDGQAGYGVDFALTYSHLLCESNMVLKLPADGGFIRVRSWDKKAGWERES